MRKATLAFVGTALALVLTPSGLAGHQFTDVPDTHPFHAEISVFKDTNITSGCTATEFCPDNTVKRQAMAAFIDRALGLVVRPGEATQNGVPGSRVAMLDDGVTKVVTDSGGLNLWVGATRLLRLENATFGSNVIAGADNSVGPGLGGASIGGGNLNVVYDVFGVIGGGRLNRAGDTDPDFQSASGATVGGGFSNWAAGHHSVVAGGSANIAAGEDAAVVGGYFVDATGDKSFAGGGYLNDATGTSSTIAGGSSNEASGGHSGALSGFANRATGATSALVAGGTGNLASGSWSTVPGGANNTAGGDYSFSAGRRAKANHSGALVWADSKAADFSSLAIDEFSVRATGGARFVTAIDTDATNATPDGTPTAGVTLASGAGSWSNLSDRAAKRHFAAVNGQALLDRLARVSITTWSYKTQKRSVRHIGPTAQDFAKAFQVGEDDRRIATVDADGVALAAIQALNTKLQRENRLMKERLVKQSKRIAALELRFARPPDANK